jgi:hypothetical protein
MDYQPEHPRVNLFGRLLFGNFYPIFLRLLTSERCNFTESSFFRHFTPVPFLMLFAENQSFLV